MASPSPVRFRPRRWGANRGRITRAGWWYLGITLFLGAAGINTGNNLLFLIFGQLLSGLLLSGVLRVISQSGISVERSLPGEATVGQPLLVGLKVTNHKKRLGSYALVVRDVTARGTAGQSFVLMLGPGQTRELSYRWEPEQRGRVAFTRVELVTRFPFGLLEGVRDVEAPGEVVVFPRDVAINAVVHRRDTGMGERPSGTTGLGTEFFGLRDQRQGDDARSIHWLTSARRGRTVVVEHERERRRRVTVMLDNRREALRLDGTKEDALLDRLVEVAAAAARRCEKEGCDVSCSVAGEAVPSGSGQLHLRRILRLLALVQPADIAEPPTAATGSDRVVISPSDLPPDPRAAA